MASSGIDQIRKKLKEESRRYFKEAANSRRRDSVYDYPFLNFMHVMTLCHSVVCDVDSLTGEIRYQASSPDELALI